MRPVGVAMAAPAAPMGGARASRAEAARGLAHGVRAGAAPCVARRRSSAATSTAAGRCACGPKTARPRARRHRRASATCRCRRTSSARTATPIASAIRRSTRASAARSRRRRPDCTSRRRLLDALAARGVERAAMTLHVGYGTFQPIRVDDGRRAPDGGRALRGVAGATAAAIARARAATAAASSRSARPRRARSSRSRVRRTAGRARQRRHSLFIRPGPPFRVVDGLVTNFHLPQSSLLMLVAAFAGREHVLAAYRDAVRERLSLLQLRGRDADPESVQPTCRAQPRRADLVEPTS